MTSITIKLSLYSTASQQTRQKIAKVLQSAAALLLVAALLLLLAPCDGRELKACGATSGGAASGGSSNGSEDKDTGLPLIPTLPPVLDPVVPLPPVVPGLPPARESDKSP